MARSPPNVRLRSQSGAGSFDDADVEERTPRTRPLGRRADDNGGVSSKDRQSGGSRLLSATSAAFTRVKGMAIRSGSSGRVLNPRSVTLVSRSRERRGDGSGDNVENNTEERRRSDTPLSPETYSNNSEGDNSRGETNGTPSFEETEKGGNGDKSNKQKLSVLFDDDESDTENRSEEGSASTNDNTPRSKWASTLMASTLAREKRALQGREDLLPHPRDAGNKVCIACMGNLGGRISFTCSHTAKNAHVRIYASRLDICTTAPPRPSATRLEQITNNANSPYLCLCEG